jgi:DNA repair protein SbcD/Mre11
MIRILHCADIHLKAGDADYGLTVLREIASVAKAEGADLVLICGDLFDTFADAEALRRDFAPAVAAAACEALYLPGNHEDLQRTGDLAGFDFTPAVLLHQKPFALVKRSLKKTTVEFLCIPHQPRYGDWRSWEIPPKDSAVRIALAHALVDTMAYSGPQSGDIEDGGAVMEGELFRRHQVDYAALGHIHGARTVETPVLMAYPGSATVWRAGEEGPRSVLLLDIGDDGVVRPPRTIELASAGRYRAIPAPMAFDASLPDLSEAVRGLSASDHVELVLSGLVENDHLVNESVARITAMLKGKVRVLDVNRSGVAVMPGIASQPLAAQFLKVWEKGPAAGSGIDDRTWRRARELALLTVKEVMESKQ